jgi:hypothetical protein
MNTRILRAAAAAFLIGGASVAVIATLAPVTAQAAGVRASVGTPLKEAISLAGSGHGSEALAKVQQAQSVGGLSAAEQQAISQTKEYIAAKTGQGGGASACRAKFTNDYNAGRYRDAIADADCLRQHGSFSGNDQLVVAQAYYLSGDYAAAIRAARASGGPSAQELMLSAAFKSGDQATMREVLESLISSGHSQYWAQYLTSAENAHGLQDHQTLDLLRLRFRTGTLRSASDYELAAELSLQVGSPQEAVDIMQKGFDAKVLTDNRAQRLLTAAKTAAAKDSANLAAMQKTADAAPTGDADVKIGEELNGFGKYADAITAIQNGIKKGVTDKGNAQVRLGVAYMGAGQHDAAQSAFAKVPKDGGNWPLIAHIWSIYARSH